MLFGSARLTLVLVVIVLLLLALVVAPQLAETVAGLGVTIQDAAARFLLWAEAVFAENPQVVHYLQTLSFDWRSIDWQSILSSVVDFLRDGAGSMLSSTISAAGNLVSGIATFFISFVFSIYILLQKEKLAAETWTKDEYRQEMLLAVEGICVIAQLREKLEGRPVTGVVDTQSWLARYRQKWLQKNKPQELPRMEAVFTYCESIE